MKAIILAAGMGTRLGKYTKNIPKCMLEFAGKSLLETQVKTLKSLGIEDIVVIKGYEPDKIVLEGFKYYTNEKYEITNMVETLFCAEKELEGEVLVVYGDIIYEKNLLVDVINSSSDIGVAVDEDYWDYWSARLQDPLSDIESLVIGENGSIVDIGNSECALSEAKVRYIGMIKFSEKGIETLKSIYHKKKSLYYNSDEKWLRSTSFKKAYMTCMLQAIINEGHDVQPITVRRGWLEFDNVEDYEKYLLWNENGQINKYIKINEVV
jgi:L-glutamine-phosphate cytidylyltransferase